MKLPPLEVESGVHIDKLDNIDLLWSKSTVFSPWLESARKVDSENDP